MYKDEKGLRDSQLLNDIDQETIIKHINVRNCKECNYLLIETENNEALCTNLTPTKDNCIVLLHNQTMEC